MKANVFDGFYSQTGFAFRRQMQMTRPSKANVVVGFCLQTGLAFKKKTAIDGFSLRWAFLKGICSGRSF